MISVAEWFQINGDLVSTIALVATLIVLIFYTIYTHGLKKATVKQTELQLRPILTITLGTTNIMNNRSSANLKNIGLSPALNIRTVVKEATHIDFIDIPIVEKGKDKKLAFRIDGQRHDILSEIEADVPVIKFRIEYENIEKQKYITEVMLKLSEHKVEFLKTCKN